MGQRHTETLCRRCQQQKKLLSLSLSPEKEAEAQSNANHEQTAAEIGVQDNR